MDLNGNERNIHPDDSEFIQGQHFAFSKSGEKSTRPVAKSGKSPEVEPGLELKPSMATESTLKEYQKQTTNKFLSQFNIISYEKATINFRNFYFGSTFQCN